MRRALAVVTFTLVAVAVLIAGGQLDSTSAQGYTASGQLTPRAFLPLLAAGPPAVNVTATPIPATPTPPAASATPTATATPVDANVAIVFLQGWGTSLPNGDYGDFDSVALKLMVDGFSPSQFLNYSYTGGTVVNGVWEPYDYGCSDTANGVAAGVTELGSLLRQYSAAHPSTQFILVGHSMGGLVALSYLYNVYFYAYPQYPVSDIVTVDSPLYGVSPGKDTLYSMLPCNFGGQFTDDLTWFYDNQNALATDYAAMIQWFGGGGGDVRTYGNQNDCWYWPSNPACPYAILPWSDGRYTQYIYGDAVEDTVPVDWSPDTTLGIFQGTHRAVLTTGPYDDAIALRIESDAQSMQPGHVLRAQSASTPKAGLPPSFRETPTP